MRRGVVNADEYRFFSALIQTAHYFGIEKGKKTERKKTIEALSKR